MRLAVTVGAALLSSLAAAGAAWACNEPYMSASPSSAGPGDTIRWTIGNVEPRAKYTVTVAGRAAGEGVAGASAPTGTYEMPDFGSSPRDVPVQFTLTHEESSPTHAEGSFRGETDSYDIAYRPPVPAPEPAPKQPEQAAPAPSEPGGGLGVVGPPEKNDAGGKTVGPGPRTDPPVVRQQAPRSPAPVPIVAPVADQQVPERPAVPAHVQPRAEDRQAVAEKAPRAVARGRLALPGPQPSRRLPLIVTTPTTAPTPAEEDEGGAVPAIVVVGLSTLVVVGVGSVALWALWGKGSAPGSGRESRGPQWVPPGLGLEAHRHDLLVEAELQELIAEERARQVAREAGAIRTRPG